MKKLSILAFALGLIAFTACSEKKAPAPAQTEQTVVTDSAFQAAAAGEYKSADGERSVTLNSEPITTTKKMRIAPICPSENPPNNFVRSSSTTANTASKIPTRPSPAIIPEV